MNKSNPNGAQMPTKKLIEDRDSDIDEDPDYTSSSGSSTEDESEAADQSSQPKNHSNQPGQTQQRPATVRVDNVLRSRLATFIPQLQRANQELEASEDTEARRIDHVDENEKHYIEMDLGLGVLSERQRDSGGIHLDQDDSDDESTSENEAERRPNLLKSEEQQASDKKKIIEEI